MSLECKEMQRVEWIRRWGGERNMEWEVECWRFFFSGFVCVCVLLFKCMHVSALDINTWDGRISDLAPWINSQTHVDSFKQHIDYILNKSTTHEALYIAGQYKTTISIPVRGYKKHVCLWLWMVGLLHNSMLNHFISFLIFYFCTNLVFPVRQDKL